NELSRRVVNHLAWDGVELELGHESFDHHRIERQEIEEERALGRGGQRNEIATVQRINSLMDVTQVRRFPTKRRAVIDNFELNLSAGVINDRHATAPISRKCAKVSPPARRSSCVFPAAMSPPRARRRGKCFRAQKN